MAKLSAKARDKMPASKFGEPKDRKYPMPDKSHAVDAKSRASEMAHKGKLSGAAEKAIDKKADRVISRITTRKPPR
jgi:hypothetical protein